jgi:tetratricopeptide (TPR) repeat protein
MHHDGHGVRGLIAVIVSLLLVPPALGDESRDQTFLEEPAPTTAVPELAEINPLAITPEMKAFVDEKVAPRQSRRARVHRLQQAIFDPKEGLGVTYGSERTHTAAGTFKERSGNCLSFTLLFVALARHLSLDTYFVEVDEVTGWSQRGEVGLSHWHMYAEVEVDGIAMPVDFLPWTESRYRSSRRISEERVRAHYHNNVGADLITANDPTAALAHFERSLELDSGFNPAKINMAVAHRRNGQSAQAEALLLEVLKDEPGNAVAAANLATLYVQHGRHSEAAKWIARREKFLKRNPFHHFRLGMRAFESGKYSRARDHFKRAIARQTDEAVFFEQLAEAQFRLGDARKGRSALRRALRLTENADRRQIIEERLNEEAAQLDHDS